ncbi:MAG: hypothetical protein JNJ40_15965 [Bacteroidia bacterium]|nr:hypothetical protein [Bacteroidia bacterium]
MKQLIFSSAFILIIFTSCDKQFTCECITTVITSSDTTAIYNSHVLEERNSTEARASCSSLQSSSNSGSIRTTTTCKLQ